MKKLLLTVMVLLMATLAFASGAGEQPAGPVEVMIWHGFIETEEALLRAAVDEFNASAEDVVVDLLAVPFDQLQNKFQTESAAGGGPALVIGPQDRMAGYNQAGLLAEIDGSAAFMITRGATKSIPSSSCFLRL